MINKPKPIPRFINPKPVLKKPEMPKLVTPTEVNSFRMKQPDIPPQAYVDPRVKPNEEIQKVVIPGKGAAPDMRVGNIDSIRETQIYKRPDIDKQTYQKSMQSPMRKRALPQDLKDDAQKNIFKLGDAMDEVEAWQRYDAALKFEPEKYGNMEPEDFFKQIGYVPGTKRLERIEAGKPDLEDSFWDEEKNARLEAFGLKPFSAFGPEEQNKIIADEVMMANDLSKEVNNEISVDDFLVTGAQSLVERGMFETEEEAMNAIQNFLAEDEQPQIGEKLSIEELEKNTAESQAENQRLEDKVFKGQTDEKSVREWIARNQDVFEVEEPANDDVMYIMDTTTGTQWVFNKRNGSITEMNK